MQSDITYTEAANKKDIQRAAEFATAIYVKRGILPAESAASATLSAYLLFPASRTFLAHVNGTLIGTVSLVPDSEKGLHMDMQYKNDLDTLRKEGRSIAEVTLLAVDEAALEHTKQIVGAHTRVLGELYRSIVTAARERGITTLCITVAPWHARLYTLLGFTSIGSSGEYQLAEDGSTAPGVPMILTLDSQAFNDVEERMERMLGVSVSATS